MNEQIGLHFITFHREVVRTSMDNGKCLVKSFDFKEMVRHPILLYERYKFHSEPSVFYSEKNLKMVCFEKPETMGWSLISGKKQNFLLCDNNIYNDKNHWYTTL